MWIILQNQKRFLRNVVYADASSKNLITYPNKNIKVDPYTNTIQTQKTSTQTHADADKEKHAQIN